MKRLGFELPEDEAKLEEALEKLSEQDVVQRVLANDTYTKAIRDEAIKQQDTLLISKMQKQAENLGLSKEQVEAANGDIKKLFATIKEHVTEQTGKGDDEKQKQLDILQTKVREYELKVEEGKKQLEEAVGAVKQEYQGKIQQMSRAGLVKDSLLKVGLTEGVTKDLPFYQRALQAELDEQFDFVEEGGKLVALKKGTEDKVFKEGSAENATLGYLVEQKAVARNWKKETNVDGKGDPERGGGNQGGGGSDPKVVDRYAGAIG